MIVLPEDLESMEERCYIHDAEKLKWAAIGVEDARTVEMVEMSMLLQRQLSEDLSKDRNSQIMQHLRQSAHRIGLSVAAIVENQEDRRSGEMSYK